MISFCYVRRRGEKGVLIVGIEDDQWIALIFTGQVLPKGLKASSVLNDTPIKPPKVMGIDNSVRAVTGDVVDCSGIVCQVRCCQRAGQALRRKHTLHGERHSEDVEPLVDQRLPPWSVPQCWRS